MVREQLLNFSPESVKVELQLPQMLGDPHSCIRRVNSDPRSDQILAKICVEGAQWRRDAKDKPYQLGRIDLKNEGEVHEVIPQELYKVAEKTST
ncbi:hypothetical protein AHAS_Ahas20G0188900 [Arachis hypogaea]